MAWLPRDTRSTMILGGSVLSAIADTWTYIAASYLGVWIVVSLLGL